MEISKSIRLIFVAFLINIVLSLGAEAAIIKAADCSQSAVQTAINSASNGDTVSIPAGSCSWTSGTGISTSKQIDIEGAGSSTSGTVITHNGGSATLFTMTIGSSNYTKIGNIRFMCGSASGGVYVQMTGTGLPPILHGDYFDLGVDATLLDAVQWYVTGGVIYNTTFESDYNINGACGADIGSSQGCLVVKSNLNWDSPSTMGTADTTGTSNLYIENTTFNNVGQCPDCDDNCRIVLRYSTINGSSGCTHGPTSAQGGRHVEIYNDVFEFLTPNRNLAGRYWWFRGGTALITANSIADPANSCYGSNVFQFIVESATRTQSHGCCTSWMCWHQPGSGSSGTSGQDQLSSGQTGTVTYDSCAGAGSPGAYYDTCQRSDPVYIWGNSGTGNTVTKLTSMNDYSPDQCGNGVDTADFFVSGRDYFVSTTSSGAKPGWSPYTCPHPLTGLTGSCNSSVAGPTGYNVAGSSPGIPNAPAGLSIMSQ